MHLKEVSALLLAGGQGNRLGVLTRTLAKPAVLYGGKYRIIDFTLSNCVNSGIDNVGVLTQYQPLKLHSYIGIGKPWDLDRVNGGVTMLPPHLKSDMGQWYKGTANAVFQNIDYLDSINPKYVIVLSGDHIYKMDYSLMLDFHKAKGAHATISVIDVPMEETHRYGIMNTNPDGSIYEFEEKPKKAKSTLASMGVYIFDWKVLREALIEDEQDSNSSNDFGKNIIPAFLAKEKKVFAYPFEGYWKDVGTIKSFWESNMDLVSRVPQFNLFDHAWPIYTVNPYKPANYVGPNGSVKRSIVADGCAVLGSVSNSVIFPGVFIDEGVEIKDSIILSNTKILNSTKIEKSVVCENCLIGSNVKIGFGKEATNNLNADIYNSGITVVGEEACVPNDVNIGKNVMIDIGVGKDDFKSQDIKSGSCVIKGGGPL